MAPTALLQLSGCTPLFSVQRLASRKDLIMNKNPHLSAMPALGTRVKNLAGIASLIVISLSLCHAAQSVRLAWDASSDSSIAGYRLRYGTISSNLSQTAPDVSKTTTRTISNLNEGTTYHFAVTAFNAEGIESAPSNQVSYRTPTTPTSNTHVLTVINGTGSGPYPVDAQVPVSATLRAGQQFAVWIGDDEILANRMSSTTTATMPSIDATIEATYKPAPPPNQVTALSFSEGSGTFAADNSGSGHNGTLVNGATWTAGKFDNGLSLDSTNDYVSVANPSTLNFGTSDFTIALWLKRQATGVEHTILSKTANMSWTSGGKELFINGSNNTLGFGSFGVGEAFSTGTFTNDGLWHHVAVTFVDGSNTITFYIDGVASGGGTLNLPADVGSHVVKLGSSPAPHYFRGQLDELRIFDRALSSSEVQSIMNNAIE
jgi:hypothetical protein